MSSTELAPKLDSIAEQSVEEGVENDKCVVGQYKTSLEQKNIFKKHMAANPKTAIPVEWVIDIADESNGWFYGTAYHFDDTTQMLHVMVPDKLNPSFDGNVVLDHRTVHLIECVDGKTEALFNKVVRDSVVKVKWEVEWFEEDTSADRDPSEEGANGKWVISTARYYIRMANQLLVEDENFGQESRGFVMLTADLNVKLRGCHKGKGQDDFNRLVNENITQSTPEAAESVRLDLAQASTPVSKGASHSESAKSPGDSQPVSVKRLADISKGLRECVSEILDEREKTLSDKAKIADQFQAFVMNGDLDAGLLIMDELESAKEKDEEKENTADEAWFLVQKLEKNLQKLVKNGDAVGGSASGSEDVEILKKSLRKLKKDLEDKTKELESLRGKP